MLLRLMVFLAVPVSYAAAAAPPTTRQPTGKWVVNFADAQCLATRSYGTNEKPLSLILKAPPLGDVMQIAIIRQASSTNAAQVEAQIGFDGQPPLKSNMLMYSPKEGRLRVHLLNMKSTDFSPVRQAKSLSVRSGGLNETFALSGVEPLLKVMDKCVTGLRQAWNIGDSLGAQSTLGKRAHANVFRLFKSDDYPAQAVAENKGGTLQFAVLVDESGRVADCTIIETSGVAVLDAQTCAVMGERAKFEPALGSDGKPAKDALISRITWRLPG